MVMGRPPRLMGDAPPGMEMGHPHGLMGNAPPAPLWVGVVGVDNGSWMPPRPPPVGCGLWVDAGLP